MMTHQSDFPNLKSLKKITECCRVTLNCDLSDVLQLSSPWKAVLFDKNSMIKFSVTDDRYKLLNHSNYSHYM